MPKLTPSMTARMRLAGVKLLAEMPTMEPRLLGRSGVRSPLRNGMKQRPSAPGVVARSAASMSATVLPRVVTVWVTTLVAFIVQTNGSQPPEDEQKGATLPVGSSTGCVLKE